MKASSSNIIAYLRSLVQPPGEAADNDRELVQRFLERRDADAFAALMRRHGPMVLNAAHRITGDAQLAEDVFQATFLLLSRKAHTLRRIEALPCWLHGVVHRLAVQARRAQVRRREREARVLPAPSVDPLDELTARELVAVLDEEIGKLPENQRAPLILCCLEGLSQEEAAKRLGCSPDAVRGRLERGRQRLRQRLEKRGLTLPAVLGGTLLSVSSTNAVPFALAQATLTAATKGVGATPAAVALLQEVGKMMFLGKVKMIGVVVFLFALGGAGAGMMALRPQAMPKEASPQVVAADDKPLSPKQRVDLYGDPLPEGASMRLGTLQRRAVRAQLAVTADGKSIITAGGGDKYIRVWDALTGQLRQKRELSPAPTSTVCLLSADGRSLVAQGEGFGHLGVWDVATGKQSRTLILEGSTFISPCTLSLDGKTLVIKDQTKGPHSLRIWDMVTNKERFTKSPKGWTECFAALSPDGKYLLAASLVFDEMFCWEAVTGKQRWHIKNLGVGSAVQPAFTPDSTKAFFNSRSANRDGVVALATGQLLPKTNLPKTGSFDRLTLSPDGQTLLVSTPKGVRVWDLKIGVEKRLLAGAGEQVVCLPDGKSIVSNNGSLQRWNVATGKPLWPDSFAWGHADAVRTLAFSRDGKRLVSGSADGTVRVWNTTTGKSLHTWHAHDAVRILPFATSGVGVSTVAINSEGRWILSGGFDRQLKLWDAATGKLARSLPLPQHQQDQDYHHSFQVRISADGTKAFGLFLPQTGFVSEGKIRYRLQITGWELQKEERLWNQAVESSSAANFALSEDGQLAVVERTLWDATSGRRLLRLEEGMNDERPPFVIDPYVFSRDGALVAGCFERWPVKDGLPMRGIRVWETATGKPIAQVSSFANDPGIFHPNGRLLALHENTTILLWDIVAKRQVHRWEMPERADSLAFTADGHRLATGMSDGTILLWDIPLATAKPQRLEAMQLESLWGDLVDTDAAKAWRAVWRLSDAPKDALALLRSRVKPYPTAPTEKTRKLLADLDSDAFVVREEAAKQLKELGLQAEPALRAALKAKPSLEQRKRIEPLLATLAEKPEKLSGEDLRQMRALIVLERIGTPEARRLLEEVAKGPPSARLTRQAQAARMCRP